MEVPAEKPLDSIASIPMSERLASPSAPDVDPTTPSPPVDPSKLTPEEQMALFEKELKETDWGHQPC